jgi:PAS domain S-box-containing protein
MAHPGPDPRAEAVLESLGEAVYAVDTEARVTYLNPEAERLLGWSLGELVGHVAHDRFHAHPAGTPCPGRKVLATGRRTACDDDRFLRRGGSWLDVSWIASPLHDIDGAVAGAVVAFRDVHELRTTRDALRREAQRNETLLHMARQLTGELDLQELLQSVTDAGVLLTRAAFGAFFYDLIDERGESYTRYTISGVPRAAFERFPLPRNSPILRPTFEGERIVRFDDITAQPEYGTVAPHHGTPGGHLPVRSYLAVPVVSRRGEPIGGLFFGHPDPGIFTDDDERMIAGIASHAAVAVDNARLYDTEKRVAEVLQRSLLPRVLPALPGIVATARYEPSSTEAEVGGDWYDLIPLPGGAVGAVIGDVAGHNVVAATVMGQLRNALRGYALEGHPPTVVLERANRFLCLLEPDELATCCYVELDPREGTATIVSAGHPPPLLVGASGIPMFPEIEPGPPIGCDPETSYSETTVLLHDGARLLLYTDGLVERRDASLADGMRALADAVAGVAGATPDEIADAVLATGRPASLADDTALLVLAVGPREELGREVKRRLPCDPASPAVARHFVGDVLAEWGHAELVDVAQLLVSELVTNGVLHTATSLELRLRVLDDVLRVEVHDGSAERPLRLQEARAEDTAGRGLYLVEAMSSRWAVEPAPVGKVVWFELDLAPDGDRVPA